MARYIVSHTLTYQTEIEADSEEQARELFREMDLNDIPILDSSDIETVEEVH